MQNPNWSRGQSRPEVLRAGPAGQSSVCLLGTARERWERRVSRRPWVSRHLWHRYVSGTWLLRILAHDRWIQVWHLLHSIMARPAKGFMQKHVTRSHESSSGDRGHRQAGDSQAELQLQREKDQLPRTRIHHDVLIFPWSVLVSEHHLLPLAEHCSVSWKALDLLHSYHAFIQVLAVPILLLLAGLLLAKHRTGEVCRVEWNADVVLRLVFDCLATDGDGVLELWDYSILSNWELLLLPPLLLLQLVGFSALVCVPAGDWVLVTDSNTSVKRTGGEATKPMISENLTYIVFGMAGEQCPWLQMLPIPVMGDFGRALGAGGGGSWGPAITVSCAASAVGGARTTAQWRVLKQKNRSCLEKRNV